MHEAETKLVYNVQIYYPEYICYMYRVLCVLHAKEMLTLLIATQLKSLVLQSYKAIWK